MPSYYLDLFVYWYGIFQLCGYYLYDFSKTDLESLRRGA